MVVPSTSTASCLPVNGRSGVGIRILFAMSVFYAGSFRALRSPRRYGPRLQRATTSSSLWLGRCDGHDHVPEKRPRVIEIVLRRTRRMIRDASGRTPAAPARARVASCSATCSPTADQEPPARPLLGRVRQRERAVDDAVARQSARRSIRSGTSRRRARRIASRHASLSDSDISSSASGSSVDRSRPRSARTGICRRRRGKS